jgi:hypothetical protein
MACAIISSNNPSLLGSEDIVRARLDEDPALAQIAVDFRTAPSGELEIRVDGESCLDVGAIPDGRLQEVIRQAIESWEQRR